jgi:hypothetical protein
MPTPNEQDEEVYALLLSNKGRCADLAAYRESIIASEREAAADRWELLIYWAFPWGKYTLAELRARASEEQLKEIAEGRTAILSGQSASPKDEPDWQTIDRLYAVFMAGWQDMFAPNPKDCYGAGFADGKDAATPLQEARDRGDRLGELLYQAQSVIEFYATPPPLTASGKPQRACDMQAYEVLHRLVEARAALAAEGKL